VASADPRSDAVVLWTRVTPGGAAATVVEWKLSREPDLGAVAASGQVATGPHCDFTASVDVTGLEPATTYWYRFSCQGAESPLGRTRTAPAGPVDRLRMGVACCSHWSAGHFNAYGRLADRDLDVVLHLGDYIYEDETRSGRDPRPHDPPGRMTTLAGYRARHAQYKTDPDLQRLHSSHPVVAVWDDHEVAGNSWTGGAARHDPHTDGDWEARRAAGVQAYREWVPLHRPDSADPDRLWRSLAWGDLARIIVLDTRLYGRDRPAAGLRPVMGVHRRDRSLLGDGQRRWVTETLSGPAARWCLLASQVMVAPLHALRLPRLLRPVGRPLGAVASGLGLNPGQWDGYPAERETLLRAAADGPAAGGLVVVSGDLHSSWATEIPGGPDGDADAVAVEFGAPAVSAPTFARALAPRFPGAAALLRRILSSQNPHVRWCDIEAHGYFTVDLTPARIQADFWHVDRISRRVAGERWAGGWQADWGNPQLRPAQQPAD
jgi:alkaline phosphatase D